MFWPSFGYYFFDEQVFSMSTLDLCISLRKRTPGQEKLKIYSRFLSFWGGTISRGCFSHLSWVWHIQKSTWRRTGHCVLNIQRGLHLHRGFHRGSPLKRRVRDQHQQKQRRVKIPSICVEGRDSSCGFFPRSLSVLRRNFGFLQN